jgi:hypothetical protein
VVTCGKIPPLPEARHHSFHAKFALPLANVHWQVITLSGCVR